MPGYENSPKQDLETKTKHSAYNLEYELTQLKIDNYGKSIIQIRAMALTISGIMLTLFYQNNLLMVLVILLIILLYLLAIENDHHCEQQKLYIHVIKLEKAFTKIDTFRFKLGRELSTVISSTMRMKVLKKSWLMLLLIFFNVYSIIDFVKSDFYKMNDKLIKINNDYKESLFKLYKINDDIISVSNSLLVVENKKEELRIDIDKLNNQKSKILKTINELKKDKFSLQTGNAKIGNIFIKLQDKRTKAD